MRWCWNQDPSERPSFTQILDIANNPKFLRLIDNVQLITLLPVTCATSFIPAPDEASDAKTGLRSIFYQIIDQTYSSLIRLNRELNIYLNYVR